MQAQVVIKRAYEEPSRSDGYRVLVDRVWPRGRTRDELALDAWMPNLAPSAALREWFGHDPGRWEEFRKRYERELARPEQEQQLRALLAAAKDRRVTLVYGAKDEERNQAVVLRDILLSMQAKSAPKRRG